MSSFSIILALWIVLGFSLRDILQKYSAKNYQNDYEAGSVFSIFMVIGILLSIYFLRGLLIPINYKFSLNFLTDNKTDEAIFYPMLIAGIIKGFVVFNFNSKARNLDLTAVSGATYLGFIAISFAGLINHFLFKEDINIIPILGLSIAALFFYLLGPGKKVINAGKFNILSKAILLFTCLIVLDYIGIRASNWYIHLIISNLTSFFIFLYIYIKMNIIKNLKFLNNKYILLSALLYVIMEFSFVYSFSVLGVSYAFLFGMLSYLPTMLYGSIKYNEGKWYVQALFCIIAIIFVYFIAFDIKIV